MLVTWSRMLKSDNVAIGVMHGLKVTMRKASSGAGLLVKSPSLYLPSDRQPQLPGQSLKDSHQASQLAS